MGARSAQSQELTVPVPSDRLFTRLVGMAASDACRLAGAALAAASGRTDSRRTGAPPAITSARAGNILQRLVIGWRRPAWRADSNVMGGSARNMERGLRAGQLLATAMPAALLEVT